MIRSKHVQITISSKDFKSAEIEMEAIFDNNQTLSPEHIHNSSSNFDSENSIDNEKLIINNEDENANEK